MTADRPATEPRTETCDCGRDTCVVGPRLAAWKRLHEAARRTFAEGTEDSDLYDALRESDAALAEAAQGAAPLTEAVRQFLDTAYPNNGEGHTDRLVWQVPESAFGPLREAIEGAAPRAEGLVCPIHGNHCQPGYDHSPAESHIVPEDTANDVAEHITDFLDPLACWCGPYRDTEEPEVIIHRKEGEA